jgi:hypothetical protein
MSRLDIERRGVQASAALDIRFIFIPTPLVHAPKL